MKPQKVLVLCFLFQKMFMLGAKTTARIRAFTQPRRERGEQERDIAREKNKVKKTSLKKGNKRSK